MPVETHIHDGVVYRKANEIWANDGTWRNCKEKWVCDSQNIWRKVFHRFFEYTTDIQGVNFNLRTAALATGQWDGVTPILANLRVVGNLGAQPPAVPPYNPDYNGDNNVARRAARAAFSNYPAFDSGNLPVGSIINLTVMPGVYLVGAGGDGGNNWNTHKGIWNDQSIIWIAPWLLEDGGNGSPAIRTTVPMNITNNGIIGGGGGGGAGGAGLMAQQNWSSSSFNHFSDGGFGGGGAGYVNGKGSSGYSYQSYWETNQLSADGGIRYGGGGGAGYRFKSAPVGNRGGRGGDLGQNGENGGTWLNAIDRAQFPQFIRYGGTAGKAVIGSGLVTWLAYGQVYGDLA